MESTELGRERLVSPRRPAPSTAAIWADSSGNIVVGTSYAAAGGVGTLPLASFA
ncbi:hypothetical protein [Actinomycetospora lemnae]|uniref:Uncharacterized protein n=1 Tax=Actinomycetospora lemnae TaxID=3019891 RepID=A0ABT5SSA3_9PSEU|nr:hypothetical protein [Actinomycetospora sp. DW7H6]MDD7965730.1 hypothetical protein [Actinomycetospora sp. DW7H6]